AFLHNFIGSAALSLALKSGLIDKLNEGGQSIANLAAASKLDLKGVALLADLLDSAGVVSQHRGVLELTPAFTAVLGRRAALQSKLAFLDLAARDTLDRLPAMLFDTGAYIASGEVFKLFRYDRAKTISPEDIAFTRRWVDYTTALSEHEGPLLAPLMDLRETRRLLDVGGNSGAFARALCAANPALTVTVLDLPAVVEIGSRYVAAFSEAPRVSFAIADIRRDPLPAGHDAICFKSVLHDWPDDDVGAFLVRAHDALPPGGRLFIAERGEFTTGGVPLPYSATANLAFSRFYRPAGHYAVLLSKLGFADVSMKSVQIEMPFHVTVGTRP
ncbi:MAG: methyltransferase domain-containing protein, partial [Sphingomonadales bacterium]